MQLCLCLIIAFLFPEVNLQESPGTFHSHMSTAEQKYNTYTVTS